MPTEPVCIPAGEFTSTISQADADAKALAAAFQLAAQTCPPVVFFNAEACVTCPIIDNGSDPFLGPPYPPIGFSANAHLNPGPTPPANTAHLEWTLPDLFISTLDSPFGFGSIIFYLNNYVWDEWSVSTPYEQGQTVKYSGVNYYALRNNTGAQPNISGSDWAVDNTVFGVYMGSPPFTVSNPGGISFGGSGPTSFLGDSVNGGSAPGFGGQWGYTLVYDGTGSNPTFIFTYTNRVGPFFPGETQAIYLYFTSTKGGVTVYSPVNQYLVPLA